MANTEKTVKVENYTPAMLKRMREVYDPNADQETRDSQVAQLAGELGKTTRSVIAKLSREGVYKAKEYRTKRGEKPVSKAALVAGIAALLDVDEDVAGSLEKATKPILTRVFQKLREGAQV